MFMIMSLMFLMVTDCDYVHDVLGDVLDIPDGVLSIPTQNQNKLSYAED